MKSLNRRYIPELDQLRAYASVLVLFYHSYHAGRAAFGHTEWPQANILNALLIEGHTGVGLFIVLSGFVLANGTLGKQLEYQKFMTNRLLRIFPLMTLVMIYAVYGNADVTLSGVLAPFLLLFNTQPRFFSDVTGMTETLWTTSVEFQFYLIAPFMFLFVSQNGMRYFLYAFLLFFIFKCLCLFPHRHDNDQLYNITYYTIVGRMNQFVCGVLLAYTWPSINDFFSGRRLICATILGCSLAAAATMSLMINRGGGDFVWHRWMIVKQEIEALVWVTVIGSYVLTRPWERWPRVSKIINGIGIISFSIYILHVPVEKDFWDFAVEHGLGSAEMSTSILMGFSMVIFFVTIALSMLSYNLVEKPFLGLRKRYVEAGVEPASVV